jgi:predicted GNAT family N-acyltransferase
MGSEVNGDPFTFSVQAISSAAMLVSADPSDRTPPPHTRFKGVTVFPGVGSAHMTLEVLGVLPTEDGESRLGLLCRICDPSRAALEVMGQYLLQSGPWVTKAELAEAGLRVRSLARAVEIGLATSESERRQAYALRHLAYSTAGKLHADATALFCDAYDQSAKIVVARHKGEVVASLRLMFHGPAESFEHDAYTSLPADLDRQRVTEITRICTHPGFRGGDLLRALFQFSALEVLRAGRPVVVGSATQKLLPLYRRLGMRATGRPFLHHELGGLEHRLIVGDARRALAGRGIGPLAWNLVWAEVRDRAIYAGILEPRGVDRARVASYRMLGPLARPIAACMRRCHSGART